MPTPSHKNSATRRTALQRAADLGLAVTAIVAVGVAVAVIALRVGFAPVLSNSMSPTYAAGDVVITMSRDTHDVRVGDVVVLPYPDDPGARYAHRIVERVPSGTAVLVRTKGDDNPAPDAWQLQITSQSVPVVVGAIPKMGWTSNLVQSREARLALASVVVLAALAGIGRTRPRRTAGPTPT